MAKASHTQLTEEAAGWLVGLDSGTVDADAFEAWRAGDPRRAAAFAEVAHAWREMDQMRPMRSQGRDAVPVISRRSLFQAAAAAGVVGLVGAAGIPWVNTARASTGIGERRTVALPDGSRVELNTRTEIRWHRLFYGRTLWLDGGEIALQVAPGNAPFHLIATQPVALDTGAFNARREADVLTLLPISGHAIAGGQSVAVGQIALIGQGQAVLSPADAAMRDRAGDWRRGDLVFEGETLGAAVADFNRYLDRPIVVADTALAGQRIGGRFQSADPAPFLRALVDGFGARVVDDGKGPILVSAAQKNMHDQ